MKQKTDFDNLIGRCRCADHARNYVPQVHNRSRTYYFLREQYVSGQLICGACMQSKGDAVHGGLILSQESKEKRIVVFQAFAGYILTEEQVRSLTKIWPRP